MSSAASATASTSSFTSSKSSQKAQFTREQYDALRSYFPSSSSVTESESEDDLKSILQQLRADPVTWLSVYIDRLPEHLIRHVFAYGASPRPEVKSESDASPDAFPDWSRPSPAQRGRVKRIAQRRRRFFELVSSADGFPISSAQDEGHSPQPPLAGKQLDALEEELSLRSMRAKEPLLYQQLVGNLKLPARRSHPQTKQEKTDGTTILDPESEGLPPPLASAQPPPAPEGFGDARASPGHQKSELRPNQTKGRAFARYLQKIDDEDAKIELERRMQTEEEMEDDEEEKDAGNTGDSAQDSGLSAFQEALLIKFIRGEGPFTPALYDRVDFDESLGGADEEQYQAHGSHGDDAKHAHRRQQGELRAITDEDRWFDED